MAEKSSNPVKLTAYMHTKKSSSVPGSDGLATDLSDPSSYELLDENDTPQDLDVMTNKELRRYHLEKSMLSFEITHQKGVLISKRQIIVPGRVSLTMISLLEILGIVIGFSAGLIHFSVYSPNYLLALIVVSGLLFGQVLVYDSSYRIQRIALTVLQMIGSLILMGLVDWAFIDALLNPAHEGQRRFLLGVSALGFNFVPVLMVLHVFVLGRGTHTIEIQRNIKANDKPTVMLKTGSDAPTKQIKSAKKSDGPTYVMSSVPKERDGE